MGAPRPSVVFGMSSLGPGAIEPGSCVMAFNPASKLRSSAAVKHDGAGYGHLITIMRFSAWSHEQTTFPTPEQVMARFNCCKATAHRWLNALADCHGVVRPRRGTWGPRE